MYTYMYVYILTVTDIAARCDPRYSTQGTVHQGTEYLHTALPLDKISNTSLSL